jgi:hypothetical protein
MMTNGHHFEMMTMMMTMVRFACVFSSVFSPYGAFCFPFGCGRFEG